MVLVYIINIVVVVVGAVDLWKCVEKPCMDSSGTVGNVWTDERHLSTVYTKEKDR